MATLPSTLSMSDDVASSLAEETYGFPPFSPQSIKSLKSQGAKGTANGSASPLLSSPYHMQAEASPQHMQSQMLLLQGQMNLISQLALTKQNAGEVQSGANNRDSMLAFTLGEKIGSLGRHEQDTRDRLALLVASNDDNLKKISSVEMQQQVLQERVQQVSSESTLTRNKLEKLNEMLDSQQHTIFDWMNKAELREEHHKTGRETVGKELKNLTTRFYETKEALAALTMQVQSLENVQGTVERARQEQSTQIEALRTESSRQSNRISSLDSVVEREREQRAGAISAVAQDCKALEERVMSALQLSSQQYASQVNACRLELLAEMRRQQSGLEWTGFTPFLAQLFLPFVSRDHILAVVHAITALQGQLLQVHARRLWMLLLFGDLTARTAERMMPSLYSLCIKEIQNRFGLSAGKRWSIRLLRLVLELIIICQVTIAVRDYLNKAWENGKKKIETNMQVAWQRGQQLVQYRPVLLKLTPALGSVVALSLACHKKGLTLSSLISNESVKKAMNSLPSFDSFSPVTRIA